MSTVVRGMRNAFRNTIRTGGVTVILALSIGLALVMLLALKTVDARIASVKAAIGNTITISPAGARGFEGGGEPLTSAQLATVSSLPHITKVASTLNDRLTPTTDTSLASAIDPGTLGNRFRARDENSSGSGPSPSTSGATRTFSLPIMVTGASKVDAATLGATSLKFTSGAAIDPASTANVADIGTGLATKNNLKVGSTFTYDGTTVTVSGIYDAGNTFVNAGIIMPIAAVQKLSGQTGQVSSATVTVDEIGNVDAAVTAIKAKLGTAADVVSQQESATDAIAPLQNIQSISLYSLIGSLVAGSVITFLTMLMIVRERRREIGVLKAIGASNFKIVTQFVSESLTLTLMGAVVGAVAGLLLANPILKLLVTGASSSSGNTMGGPSGGRGFTRLFGAAGGNTLSTLHATIGYEVLLYGLAAALIIAIIGSALPAWLIAKVRPAEVMRGE